MTTLPALSLADCECRALATAACRTWLGGVMRGETRSPEQGDLKWLLAHCDEGVVWGYLDAGQWRLATEAFPHVVPQLSEVGLQQLRLFGPRREILLWRCDDGFQGRELADLPTPLADDDPLHRDEEEFLVLGDHVLDDRSAGASTVKSRFTLIGDRRGARQTVPCTLTPDDFGDDRQRRWPLRLLVRHYFTCDDTGLVRVVASRLVDLKRA